MAKKSIKESPALMFFSDENIIEQMQEPIKEIEPSEEETSAAELEEPIKIEKPQKPPKGYKENPQYIELKTQRVQIVLQPSVFKALEKLRKRKKISRNEAITLAVIDWIEKEGK